MKIAKLLVAVLALTQITFANEKVVYGEDDRLDLHEVTNSLHYELARSTAGMVPKSKLRSARAGQIKLKVATLESQGICSDARFANQATLAVCSGFLVGEDLLVTAGHCIRTKRDCKNNRWVFDYAQTQAPLARGGKTEVILQKENVYGCKKIVSRSLNGSTKDDFALIQLDRKVTDRSPLEYRTSGKVETGDPLVVIGHPTGLPTKVAAGAIVRDNTNDKYIISNLDTFAGNSGSAVFNSETGVIEGILVRGETDYKYDSNRGCRIPNTCTNEGCRGEDVTRITNISALMNL